MTIHRLSITCISSIAGMCYEGRVERGFIWRILGRGCEDSMTRLFFLFVTVINTVGIKENFWRLHCFCTTLVDMLCLWCFGQIMNFGFKSDATIGTAFGGLMRRVFLYIIVKQSYSTPLIHGVLRPNHNLSSTPHQIFSFLSKLCAYYNTYLLI